MLKNIEAAIFDMDGTLVDSMWVWNNIDSLYLKQHNINSNDDFKSEIEHLTFSQTAEYFKNKFNLEDSVEDIINDWNDMAYVEYCNNVPLKPGAKNFLDLLKKKGIKIGLATSNCTMLLEAALKKNEIMDYFDCITTSHEVSRGKNFPDIYLLCAEKLGVDPNKCIVFEDILPAVLGAKKAGMTVVGIEDKFSAKDKKEIINKADYYLSSYENIENLL